MLAHMHTIKTVIYAKGEHTLMAKWLVILCFIYISDFGFLTILANLSVIFYGENDISNSLYEMQPKAKQ